MKRGKLIEIKRAKRIIFVGDTHGDLEVSQKIIKDHLKPGNKIVFLGDYVDRGPFSKENLDFLLDIKLKNPKQIYLLQGNHEEYHILKFFPAEFWESLDMKDHEKYCSLLEELPLAVVTKNIIALHGVLPNVKNLREINKIKLGSEEWMQIAWGDFIEEKGKCLGIDPISGRPQFGKDYFSEMMKKIKKEVLIRSHQPYCPQLMFNDKCLTIFSSSFYAREKTIALLDFRKKVNAAKDLEIVKI